MAQVIEFKRDKKFTLHEAQTLLPIIQRITSTAVARVEFLKKKIEEMDERLASRVLYEQEMIDCIHRWSDKIQKLGCTPKGLWLVDFDNGQGYYCWRYPEGDLSFYHTYQQGLTGRQPIL